MSANQIKIENESFNKFLKNKKNKRRIIDFFSLRKIIKQYAIYKKQSKCFIREHVFNKNIISLNIVRIYIL